LAFSQLLAVVVFQILERLNGVNREIDSSSHVYPTRLAVPAHFIPPDFPGIICPGPFELARRSSRSLDGPMAATGHEET